MPDKRVGPLALIEVAIEAKIKADQNKLEVALRAMTAQDPSFGFHFDRESGQTVVSGHDEWQLDRQMGVLLCVYGVQINVGAPQVAYCEGLGSAVQIDRTHKMVRGSEGEFARVLLQFAPGEPDSGFVFESKIANGAVPDEFVPAVQRGLESARQEGLIAGFPVIDFKASLVDGAYHDLDSSELAFEIAARGAFKELSEKGSPRLLEPIMKVGVLTPDAWLADVIGDLNSRKGLIERVEQRGDINAVIALVPLANMFGYAGVARHLFGERVQFAMQYDHYEPVPCFEPEPPVFPPAVGMRA